MLVEFDHTTHHVFPLASRKWGVVCDRSKRVSRYFEKRSAAICYVLKIARKKDALIIHNKDGTFREFLGIPSWTFIRNNKDIRDIRNACWHL